MAKQFRVVDRDQQFLLPVDMRDWLPAGHQVWLVLDVVEQLDLSVLRSRYARGGAGRQAYDPAMLLALLIYGYCQGVRSSRAIERACHTDVAFRVICAQDPPDHTRIARFRQRHLDVFEDLFTQVLVVCARAGYVRLGIVAIDGTKIGANASIDANHDRDFYTAKVAAMTADAHQADAAEDAAFGPDRSGDEPPQGMSGRGAAGRAERQARLRQALHEITAAETVRAEHLAEQQRTAEQYLTDVRAGQARLGPPPRGSDPLALAEARVERDSRRYGPDHRYTHRSQRQLAQAQTEADARAVAGPQPAKPCTHRDHRRHTPACQPPPVKRNSSDPQSRIMPTRRGYIQGYNGQLAGSQDHFIIAADLVQDPDDTNQLQPMMTKTEQLAAHLRPHRPPPTTTGTTSTDIGVVLADNGYCSHANLTADGPDRLIATGNRRTLHTTATTNPATGPPPEHATPTQAMDHRLRTPEGAATYKKRGATIEPINGNIKDRGNLRQFLLRGLTACTAELHLTALAHNLRRLHNLHTQPA